jgi:hypothetical protein
MTSQSLVPHFLRRALARLPTLVIALIAVPVILVFSAPAAKAEMISLSGVAFVKRCPCPVGVDGDGSEESNGVLKTIDPESRFFANVVFPVSGQRVCGFRLLYRDFNALDPLIAKLFKKPVAIGGNPFAAPTLMAQVTSAAGASNLERIAATAAIAAPVINNFNSFYYVEVDAETFNLDIVGVQIDVRPAC